MEEIKVSEMLQADSIEKDNAVMIIQDGVNKKASGSIQTATGTSLSLTSVADTCKVTSNSKNLFDESIVNNLWTFADGTISAWTGACIQKYNCSEGDTFTLKATYSTTDTQNNIIAMAFFDSSNTLIGRTANNTTLEITSTAPANTAYMYAGHYVGKPTTMQLEEGSTATSYNPYNTEVGIGVKELQLEDGSLLAADGTPFYMENRRRTVNFIEIDATKQHIINTGSYQLSVFQYKADGTYLGSSEGWQNSPYTLIPNAQTGKIKIIIPNSNAKVYDISIDDIKPQVITLTPNETKSAFTYDTETIVEANGSVTIEYNTQSRLLNNDDVLDIVEPVKEYIDREIEEKSKDIYSTDEMRVGTYLGKPLYRKMVLKTLSANTILTYTMGSLGINNPDKMIVNFGKTTVKFGTAGYSSGSWYVSSTDNGNIYINSGGQLAINNTSSVARDYYICIEYTKTTD